MNFPTEATVLAGLAAAAAADVLDPPYVSFEKPHGVITCYFADMPNKVIHNPRGGDPIQVHDRDYCFVTEEGETGCYFSDLQDAVYGSGYGDVGRVDIFPSCFIPSSSDPQEGNEQQSKSGHNGTSRVSDPTLKDTSTQSAATETDKLGLPITSTTTSYYWYPSLSNTPELSDSLPNPTSATNSASTPYYPPSSSLSDPWPWIVPAETTISSPSTTATNSYSLTSYEPSTLGVTSSVITSADASTQLDLSTVPLATTSRPVRPTNTLEIISSGSGISKTISGSVSGTTTYVHHTISSSLESPKVTSSAPTSLPSSKPTSTTLSHQTTAKSSVQPTKPTPVDSNPTSLTSPITQPSSEASGSSTADHQITSKLVEPSKSSTTGQAILTTSTISSVGQEVSSSTSTKPLSHSSSSTAFGRPMSDNTGPVTPTSAPLTSSVPHSSLQATATVNTGTASILSSSLTESTNTRPHIIFSTPTTLITWTISRTSPTIPIIPPPPPPTPPKTSEEQPDPGSKPKKQQNQEENGKKGGGIKKGDDRKDDDKKGGGVKKGGGKKGDDQKGDDKKGGGVKKGNGKKGDGKKGDGKKGDGKKGDNKKEDNKKEDHGKKEENGKNGPKGPKPSPTISGNRNPTPNPTPEPTPTPEPSLEEVEPEPEPEGQNDQEQNEKKGSKGFTEKFRDFLRKIKEKLKNAWNKVKDVVRGGDHQAGKPGRPQPERPEEPEQPEESEVPEESEQPEESDPEFPPPESLPPLPPSPEVPPHDQLPPLPPSPPESGSPSPPSEPSEPTEPEEEPPEENEDDEDEEEPEPEPKKDKGKGREKCIRWLDFQEYMHYYDTPERVGPYKDLYKKPKPPTPRPGTPRPGTPRPGTPRPGKHLECLDDVVKVAIDRMKKGMKYNVPATYDEATERFIDGLEGEGESSTAWQQFKKYQETPEDATRQMYGFRIKDPIIRDAIKKEIQVQIDTINHKLHTGEWVKKQMIKGHPVNVMGAYMRIEGLKQDLATIDRLSQ